MRTWPPVFVPGIIRNNVKKHELSPLGHSSRDDGNDANIAVCSLVPATFAYFPLPHNRVKFVRVIVSESMCTHASPTAFPLRNFQFLALSAWLRVGCLIQRLWLASLWTGSRSALWIISKIAYSKLNKVRHSSYCSGCNSKLKASTAEFFVRIPGSIDCPRASQKACTSTMLLQPSLRFHLGQTKENSRMQ